MEYDEKHVPDYYNNNAGRNLYIARQDLSLPSLCGASQITVFVPKGIKILEGCKGHSSVYFEDIEEHLKYHSTQHFSTNITITDDIIKQFKEHPSMPRIQAFLDEERESDIRWDQMIRKQKEESRKERNDFAKLTGKFYDEEDDERRI